MSRQSGQRRSETSVCAYGPCGRLALHPEADVRRLTGPGRPIRPEVCPATSSSGSRRTQSPPLSNASVSWGAALPSPVTTPSSLPHGNRWILCLLRVEHQEVLVRAAIAIRQCLGIGFNVKQRSGNLASLAVVQQGQLGQDFRLAHKVSVSVAGTRASLASVRFYAAGRAPATLLIARSCSRNAADSMRRRPALPGAETSLPSGRSETVLSISTRRQLARRSRLRPNRAAPMLLRSIAARILGPIVPLVGMARRSSPPRTQPHPQLSALNPVQD
jgi:hypothetical protein